MLLLKAFLLAMVCSYGSSQVTLTQPQLSITREENKTIRIDCRVTVPEDFGQAYIHWYRQRSGAAPERILYISTQTVFDRDSDKGRFNAEKKKIGQPTCTLIIYKTSFSDTATYYCAYWDRGYTSDWIEYFGTGTQLVVSDTKAKFDPEKIQILYPMTQDGNGTHVCLIEDFFPKVFKVTWEGPNAKKNAISGEIWPPGDNKESYSVAGWLTIDDPDKTYSCIYNYENKNGSVLLHSQAPILPDNRIMPCINKTENGTTPSTDYDITESLTHTTAYLIYILLLLKSTMYYVIVLFFIYRMKSSSKRHGKKP